MRFTRLKLDAQDIQLDHLHFGLNLVYAAAVGKVAAPLVNCFHRPDSSAAAGGACLQLETDGGRHGELTWRPGLLEPLVGGANEDDRRAVSHALQSLRTHALGKSFVDFHDPARLSASVLQAIAPQASAEQFPWTVTGDGELDWERRSRRTLLETRLLRLRGELETLHRELREHRSARRDAPQAARIAELRAAIEAVRSELAAIDRALAGEGVYGADNAGLEQLRSLDAQIERADRVCQDVQRRQHLVRQRLAGLPAAGDSPAEGARSLREACAALDRQVESLLGKAGERHGNWNEDYGGYDYDILDPVDPRDATPATRRDAARRLHETADRLRGLAAQQAELVQRQDLLAESRQLRKCYCSLRNRLKRLWARRDALTLSPESLGVEGLSQRRSECIAQLKSLETRLAAERGRGPLAEPVRPADSSELSRRAARLQDEITAVELELQAEPRLVATPVARTLTLDLLEQQASQRLSTLTVGQYSEVRWDSVQRGVSVRCPDGLRRESAALTVSIQRLIALCVLLAEASQRPATPLILDNLLTLIDAEYQPAVLAMLHDYCRDGRQVVVVLSRREDVRLCESLNLSVVHATGAAVRNAWTAPQYAAAPPAAGVPSANRLFTAAVEQVSQPVYDWPARSPLPEPTAVETAGSPASPAPGSGRVSGGLRDHRFSLDFLDLISQAPFLGDEESRAMESSGVWNVADFIRADAEELGRRLRGRIATATLRSWQAQALLLCSVSRLRPYDARVLVGCGITDPVQLQHTEPVELARIVERFSRTSEGRELLRSGSPFELARIQRWIESAQRSQHLEDEGYYRKPLATTRPLPRRRREAEGPAEVRRRIKRRRRRAAEEQAATTEPKRRAQPREAAASTNGQTAPIAESRVRELRFFLDLSSDIEAGPSIGPKTAEHFYGLGIRTVRELLAADPEATAARIENRRISANTVRQWQQQAALVCQVPELRGHDAQLLVACQVTDAAELATQDPDELFVKVSEFADTKAGARLLRNAPRPTEEEVRTWVRYAKQYRQLRAA